MKRHWYDYLWLWTLLYFSLGFFNILFAWLGMIDFLVPLALAVFGGNKLFCNHFCGRGQLCMKIGHDLKCSRNRPTPAWLYSPWFRYGFLAFFLAVFGNMLFSLGCGRRGRLPAADRQPVLDIPAPLALGIYGNIRTGMGGPVQFWLLQHHAHLVSSRPCDDGPVQAENLVRLLPHGHHDTTGKADAPPVLPPMWWGKSVRVLGKGCVAR